MTQVAEATTADTGSSTSESAKPGFAWDPRILGDRAPATDGYGVHPRAVRHRARLVRAALPESGLLRHRPIVLLVIGAFLGILGWLLMTNTILAIVWYHQDWTDAFLGPTALGVTGYGFGIGLFSWAWQLGDVHKALRFGAMVAVAGVALWMIVAIAAVLLAGIAGAAKGSSSSGSGGSHGSSSSHGSSGAAVSRENSSGAFGYLVGRGFADGVRGLGSRRASEDQGLTPGAGLAVCPNCHAELPFGTPVCPKCGYVISGPIA